MEVDRSRDEQYALLQVEAEKCSAKISNPNTTLPEGLYCPMTWDGAICWPFVAAGHSLSKPCPSYIDGFNQKAIASKTCTSDGFWWVNDEINASWTNYSLCFLPTWEDSGGMNNSMYESHLPAIRQIAKIGYSVSFITLIIASCILASVRRLRCPRNRLHLQLFLSFIIRAFIIILKDAIYETGMELPVELTEQQVIVAAAEGSLQVALGMDSQSIQCKIFTSFWQYSLMANYSLIMMEGLYLHNLIFLSMFTDTSGVARYVIAGWGLPIVFVVPWIIVRATLEDTLCWTTHQNVYYFWIIRGPVTASIIVNFVLFLNITRVLFLKLFAAQAPQARHYRYRKWFKSTLVLVPLFGVHYAILLAMVLAADAGVGDAVELVWLYIDQFFSSFQGAVVALLYCFLNGEVRTELRKIWQHWRHHAQSDRSFQSNSICTQSLTLLSRAGRCSIQSLQSPSSVLAPNTAGNSTVNHSTNDKEMSVFVSGNETLVQQTVQIDSKY